MSSLTPIVRDSRQRDIVAAVGQTVFNFPSFLADTLDLAVLWKFDGEGDFWPATGYTVALISAGVGGAIVTFATAPRPLAGSPGVTVRLSGRRIGNRITDVTRGGGVSSVMLERELDVVEMTLQEVRRDIDAEFARGTTLAAAIAAVAALAFVNTAVTASIAALATFRPLVAPAFVQVQGYYAPGDGGAALYAKSASQPSHAGKFSITLAGGSVVWYALAEQRITVNMFGAGCVFGADDAPAINNAIDYLRSFGSNVLPTLYFDGGPNKTFIIQTPLNFTGLRLSGFVVDFCGSVLIAKVANGVVIDALDSEHILFQNGLMYGDPSYEPVIGLQIGRGIYSAAEGMGRGAAGNALSRMIFTGNYKTACFLNSASEVFKADNCFFWNSSTVAGATCVALDGRRRLITSSTFFTVTTPSNTISSFNDNMFTECCFEYIGGIANHPAITLFGNTNSMRFHNCYAQAEYGWMLYVDGTHVNPVFDIHAEATHISNYMFAATGGGDVKFYDAEINEYYGFTTGAFIVTNGSPGKLYFHNSELSVEGYGTSQQLCFSNGTEVHFHGTIKLGEANSGGTYNLSCFTSVSGDVFVSGATSSVTLPSIGAARVISSTDRTVKLFGAYSAPEGVRTATGSNITAAATISIPAGGKFFNVMGTTAVTKINVSGSDDGREIILRANDGFTLSNGYTNNLVLASNFVMAANNTIRLRCSGGKWWEVCRCANALV